jgi:hypothetical protein
VEFVFRIKWTAGMDLAFTIGNGHTLGIFSTVDREQASKVKKLSLLDATATVRKHHRIVSCRGIARVRGKLCKSMIHN